MKKSLVILIIALFAGIYGAEAQKSKSTVKQRYEQVGSHHSLSLRTSYGLEYGYEYVWNSGMSLIGRVGAGSEVYSSYKNNYFIGKGFNVTIEPRYYLNTQDFFSVKVNNALLIPNTTFKASLVPMYGIKREFTEHWFCEFTIGGGVGYYSGNYGSFFFEPHLQFRIGFKL